MRWHSGLLIALCAAYLALGCGTVIHGTSERVGIASLPRGARVTVDDTYVGFTPIVLVVSRRKSYVVRLNCGGYEPSREKIGRRVSGWWWLNLATAPYGLLGSLVDFASGGMFDVSTDQVAMRLVPDSTAATAPPARCDPPALAPPG